ncbi:MAG: ribonuclease HII [Paracoccaceae bacterium]
MDRPDLSLESAARRRGCLRIAGLDEVGRGPLAGPVTAAVVVLDPSRIPEGIDDSKRLRPAQRVALAAEIAAVAEVGLAHASVEEIDRLNILRASHLAMCRAVAQLAAPPDHVLVDGNMIPADLSHPCDCVVGGDALSLSIAAASIVAKVARDRLMMDLAQQFPGYGWETNMGYGSKSHIAALQDLGATPHHRRSFRPVHNILYQEKSINL